MLQAINRFETDVLHGYHPFSMSVKRRASELDADPVFFHPAKRAERFHDNEASMAFIPAATGSPATDTAAIATDSSGREAEVVSSSSTPAPPPPSTCTALVLYKPPPPVLDPGAAATVSAICNGKLPDLQQRNAVTLLLKSLTPAQRRSLAGLWEAVRDEKLLGCMLKKLPSQQLDPPAAAVQGSGNSCVVEELDDDNCEQQHSTQQAGNAAAAPSQPVHLQAADVAAAPSWQPPTQEQQVAAMLGGSVASSTGGGDAMMVDGFGQQPPAAAAVVGSPQELQQASSGPMDMEL